MLCNVMLRYDVYPMCERVSKKKKQKKNKASCHEHRLVSFTFFVVFIVITIRFIYMFIYMLYSTTNNNSTLRHAHSMYTYWGGMHNGKIRGAHGPHRPVLFFGRLLGVLAADTGLFHFTVFFIRSVEGLRLRLDCLDSSYSRLRSSM